jgi:penicillin-binding protein 1A
MTGGSLPAQTWHEIMAYAHQGIELKQIAGVPRNPATVGPILDRDGKGDAPIRPAMLTHKGVEALLRVEQLMDEAGRQMNAAGAAEQAVPSSPEDKSLAPKPRTVPGRADGSAGSIAVR